MERNPARTFEDLVVWQKAHRFVLNIYGLTSHFPKHEIYGLTSQIRRAAISIPANIAEGFGKRSRIDKARFFNIAQGSAEEVWYYLVLTRDLGYAETSDLSEQLNEVCRLLQAYVGALRTPSS